jgi:hypothetical protein
MISGMGSAMRRMGKFDSTPPLAATVLDAGASSTSHTRACTTQRMYSLLVTAYNVLARQTTYQKLGAMTLW